MSTTHIFLLTILLAFSFFHLSLSDTPPETSPVISPVPGGDTPPPLAPSSSPSPLSNLNSPPAPPPDLSPSSSPAPAPAPGNQNNSPASTPAPTPDLRGDFTGKNNAETADLETKDSKGGGMNGGHKAGIAIGVIAGVIIVGTGALVYKKRQQNIQRARFGYATRGDFL